MNDNTENKTSLKEATFQLRRLSAKFAVEAQRAAKESAEFQKQHQAIETVLETLEKAETTPRVPAKTQGPSADLEVLEKLRRVQTAPATVQKPEIPSKIQEIVKEITGGYKKVPKDAFLFLVDSSVFMTGRACEVTYREKAFMALATLLEKNPDISAAVGFYGSTEEKGILLTKKQDILQGKIDTDRPRNCPSLLAGAVKDVESIADDLPSETRLHVMTLSTGLINDGPEAAAALISSMNQRPNTTYTAGIFQEAAYFFSKNTSMDYMATTVANHCPGGRTKIIPSSKSAAELADILQSFVEMRIAQGAPTMKKAKTKAPRQKQ